MIIQTVTEDLVTRVKGVSSLGGRVGLSIGGREIDPINLNITRPAAWVVYIGDDFVSSPITPCVQIIKLNFIVKIIIDYGDEKTLAQTNLPLLHSVVQAVRGSQPTGVTGSYWMYEGQVLEVLEPNRMVWAQTYSIECSL